MGTIGTIPSGKVIRNAMTEFDFTMRGGDPITDQIAKDLRANNPVPRGYTAPDAEARLAGIAEGERLGTRPGRRTRDAYEKSATRVAAVSPKGTVYRGDRSMIHVDVFNRMMQPHEKIPMQELFDYELDAEDAGNVGYTNREGKYLSRADQAARLGYEEAEPGLAGESFVQRKLMSDMTKADRKALERSNTVNPEVQYNRRTSGRQAHQELKVLGEERTYLERINRHMKDSSVTKQVQAITRRIGALKNEAIRKGVMGITGAAGSLVTPISTYESIKGLGSDDNDTKLRSVETLLGLPDYSTGRNPTVQEQIEGEPVIDKATGQVIGGYL